MLVSFARRTRLFLLPLALLVCGTQFRVSDSDFLHRVSLFSATTLAQDALPNPFGAPLSFGNTTTDDADIDVTAVLQRVDANTVELQVTAKLPRDYYIYSMDKSFSGKSSIQLLELAGLKPVGSEWTADRAPKVVDDPDLGQTVEKFVDQVTWSRRLQSDRPIPDDIRVSGALAGQYCSSGSGGGGVCKPILPPRDFVATLATESATQAASGQSPVTESSVAESPVAQSSVRQSPVTQSLTPESPTTDPASTELHRSPVTVVPMVGYGKTRKPAPVRFTIALTPAAPKAGDAVTFSIQADIERPWHTFALDQDPEMAGKPTVLTISEMQGLKSAGGQFEPSKAPEEERPLNDIVQRVHYDRVVWSQQLTATGAKPAVSGTIRFQLCKGGTCLPASDLEFTVTAGPAISGSATVVHSDASPTDDGLNADNGAADELGDRGKAGPLANEGLVAFIVTAFGAGFIALLTPCVFPMIPVTVAFFLKQSEKDHKNPIGLAVVYCLGIIGTFTILGLLVAVAFGPTKLNELANNRWLNLAFAALFLLFALMLMGMFELRLPSWLLTWSSKRESSGGVVGALFMALTFTLVSFTCTFAFVGTLLVVAAKGDYFWPIIGMLAFSTAFASPFFLLALFPSMLKKLPRSGGWMNTVKVTMGLVELALVLKFLSVADIGFSPDRLPLLLDTTSFLIGWVVIAAVTGAYLLNMFRMSHDSPVEGISAVRCLFGILFLTISAYISVGVFAASAPTGWLWQQIAAFAPPGKPHHLLDFRVGVQQASAENRLLFLDFTGVNCVNCRRMENTVLADPSIQQALDDMVQVQLFTDEIPGIRNRVLRSELLELNRTLQSEWFGDVTLPGYAVVTPDGKQVITTFKGLDGTGGEDFLRFINAGVTRWQQHVDAQAIAGRPADANPAVPDPRLR